MSYIMTYSDVKPRIWRGHDWILPHKILVTLFAVSLLMLLIGIVILALGFAAVGGVLMGLGGCGLMVILLLCLHAYCCRYTREACTQTGQMGMADVDVVPTYAVIQKPSSLRRSDSGSKRNGTTLEKHVTLAPDTEVRDSSGQSTVAPSAVTPATESAYQIPIQHFSQPQTYSQPNSNDHSQIHSQANSYGHSQIYSQPNSFGHSLIHNQPPSYGNSHMYKTTGSYTHVSPQSTYRAQSPPSYAPPVQYPMQVYPVRSPSSTSSSIRYGFDDDYDNPAESTPILSSHGESFSSSHQTQFKSSSSQQTYASTGSGGTREADPDLPEPQTLVYPSAKRPMTFEQTSSSKMSVYDNVSSPYSGGKET